MGYERTNVVFYNDVRVADANRIGEAHQGFSVMRAALEAEQNIAPSARTRSIAANALEFARTQPGPDGAPLIDDHLVRERLARMAMEAEVADLLGLRVAFLDSRGREAGPGVGPVRPGKLCPCLGRGDGHSRNVGAARLDRSRGSRRRQHGRALSQRGRDDDLWRFQRSAPQLDRREPAWSASQSSTALTRVSTENRCHRRH